VETTEDGNKLNNKGAVRNEVNDINTQIRW
jgi:hypothetical protein